MGGMNYHIEITFEDGVCWIARIRRLNATSPPPELQDFIIQSEVATLTFLQATAITTPKVYDFALESSDNTVGVGFILMEKLPGKPLRWSSTTRQQREKVMDQMADVFIDLRKYPFSAYGSLHTPGSMQIGPFADESFTNFENCHMRTSGPFLSSREYNVAYLNFIQALILRTEKYSNRPVDAYLIHRFLIDLIPHVFTSDPSGEFFLKHADDKGDHILVDEEFNVTGIIDWEWAHTAPAEVAFNSPIGFLPVGEFYDGNNNLGEDEAIFATQLESKGRHDLANFVQTGRVLHRFRFCCGYDLVDWDGFVGLFRGLREATGVDAGQDWPEWKASALKRYANDSRLQELLDREE